MCDIMTPFAKWEAKSLPFRGDSGRIDRATIPVWITAMAAEMRKSGIDVLGDMPWGTHFCLFYLIKPFEESELVTCIMSALAK
jgi:hypothetical protein